MLKINPTKKAIAFHYTIVSEILDKIIDRKIGNDLLSDCTITFIKRYKNVLIKGKPNLLLKVYLKYACDNNDQDFEDLKKCFNKVGYEDQFQKKIGKEFLNYLNFDTCIYCNRNYTIQLTKSRARAQLDHWFPKTIFPILSLSFYNLIPCCSSCNHLKHNDEPNGGWLNALENLNHPYLDKMDFNFSYYFKNLNDINTKIVVKKNSKTRNTIIFNKTKEIYNAHSDKEIKDLIHLRYKYSKNYLKILSDTFQNISISKNESYRMIFGIEINEDDFHKRPFSKFKKDIIEELLRN